MFDLTGKRALVTGASGGIGREIAKALAAAGATVALSGTRVGALEDTAREIGKDCPILPANLSKLDEVDKLVPAVKEGAQKAERDYAAIDKMIEIKVSYDPDPELALENTRFWAPLSLTPEHKHSIEDPIEMEKAADELPIEQVAKRWIVGSDPDETVAQIKPYVDAGFTHLVFHAPGDDQQRFFDAFERDLAPRLRAL
jgi:alkanesulfonate monooxygenase SsuD/methylene tetrahydromethanopterin reductase-like flavin-dependent oxidoreductase (luciferase family)